MKFKNIKVILIILVTLIISACSDEPVVRFDTRNWKIFNQEDYYMLMPNDWTGTSQESYKESIANDSSIPNDWKMKLIKLFWADFYLEWPQDGDNRWPYVVLNIQRNEYNWGEIDWSDSVKYVKRDFELDPNWKMIRAEKQSYNWKDYIYTEFKTKWKKSKELIHFISYTYLTPGKSYVLGFWVPESIFSSEYRNLWETILGTFSLKK